MDPSVPSISVIIDTILEIPIVSSVGESTERIVSSNGIASPSADRYAQVGDVGTSVWEVHTVDEGRDR